LKPIIDFLKKPSASVSNTDLQVPDYEQIAERDMEFMTADEQLIETIEANEYEFYSNGKLI